MFPWGPSNEGGKYLSGIMNLKVKLYWPAFIPCELSKLNVFLLEDAEVNDNNNKQTEVDK